MTDWQQVIDSIDSEIGGREELIANHERLAAQHRQHSHYLIRVLGPVNEQSEISNHRQRISDLKTMKGLAQQYLKEGK